MQSKIIEDETGISLVLTQEAPPRGAEGQIYPAVTYNLHPQPGDLEALLHNIEKWRVRHARSHS
jgi:hypothetical protein